MPDRTPQWVVIDDIDRDQQLDPIPAGPNYTASIWPVIDEPVWAVQIEHYEMQEYGWERETVAFTEVPSEQEAKAWAEAWTPKEDTNA